MDNNANTYEESILQYLEEKYSEKFKVEQINRITVLGEPDRVYASCNSERFPNDLFEVELKLPGDDIYEKTEIIGILRQTELYEGELDEVESNEIIFSDNYINIIVQNTFDAKTETIDAVFVKTQITTPNKYLDVDDKDISPNDFFEEYGKDAVVYTSIFIDAAEKLENSMFLSDNAQIIICEKLQNHFILYYVTELSCEEIKSLYKQNYENNNEYFYNADSTHKYMFERYIFGKKE